MCTSAIVVCACCWLWACTEGNGKQANSQGSTQKTAGGYGGFAGIAGGSAGGVDSRDALGGIGGVTGTIDDETDSRMSSDAETVTTWESDAGGVDGGAAVTAEGESEDDAAVADSTPIAIYTLQVDAPQNGSIVGGVVTVTGYAPGFVNVEVWDATHQTPPLARVTPAADGSFSTTIDTSSLMEGSITWTVWAWDSEPGQSFTRNASVEVQLTIDQNSDDGDTAGVGGDGGAGGTSGAGGRSFLLGMFSAGSEIASYSDYLAYHPEFTINSSYQDDHHAQCGQPISGLNDINNYPVIVSAFTYNKDYAGTAQGTHDSCYQTLFSGLASKAASIYGVRVDVEFWPHPPAAEFKASFDHIVAIAKQYLPARIKYIFNPNWDVGLGGAEYVPESADIIGPDAYNNPQWCEGKSSAQCAADKFDPNHPGSIAFWTKVAQQLGKPMALPEFGDDYGDGVYIDRVADWAYDEVLVTPGMSNNVVFIAYWDSNFNEDAHLRDGAKTVFQQRFGNVFYSGSYWGTVIPTTVFGSY